MVKRVKYHFTQRRKIPFEIGALTLWTVGMRARMRMRYVSVPRYNVGPFIISLFSMRIAYLPRNVSFPTINVAVRVH